MKKILVIFTDDPAFQSHITGTAINLAKLTSCSLHILFTFPRPVFENSYDFSNDIFGAGNLIVDKTIKRENAERVTCYKQTIENICNREKIKFVVAPGDDISRDDLPQVSRFDDMIITDAHESMADHPVVDLLKAAHCPVYLVSKDTYKPQQIIFTYDGSYAGIYAIKKFSDLFPQMLDLPCHLVHIATNESDEFPREKNIKSWLPPLFSNVTFRVLHGEVKDDLVAFTAAMPGSLAVMGSFGSSKYSGSFHENLANALIAKGRSALFIAQQ